MHFVNGIPSENEVFSYVLVFSEVVSILNDKQEVKFFVMFESNESLAISSSDLREKGTQKIE